MNGGCILFILLFAQFTFRPTIALPGIDYAFNKTCKQSSVALGKLPGYAVDDNITTCTRTRFGDDNTGWWNVDLGKTVGVTSVVLSNNLDHPGRLKNFTIKMYMSNPTINPSGGKLCFWYEEKFIRGTDTVTCYNTVVGRYLEIAKLDNDKPLGMCDVKVYGEALPNRITTLTYCESRGVRMVSNFVKAMGVMEGPIECARRCSHSYGCGMFNYEINLKHCILIYTNGTRNPDSEYVFYVAC
ncbi:hypothetical protein SNE40_003626 [Patella caerulea]|uniref:Apple domain-containing protein n=1 Tax=Patella caerulea TaxID=87958 RepID=A0AAN8KGY8_PATCE